MNLTEIFVNKLKIESKVVSIDSLFNESKVKKTQYAPPYQRNYVWDGEKATYFLESILIGTEIPPLIFFRSKGRVEIIDGRQRYETILKFLHGELRLSRAGLKKLDVLNIDKKTFGSLPDLLKYDFLDTKLRVIEFSFASYDHITPADEDSVKQEIFKRYNSGITPLRELEIDKAIYFDDDLNSFFKEKLENKEFHKQFDRLFKYEDKKVEVLLQKVRQLLVIHKIPIKYYSKAKQKITDKYYDLLSSQIRVDQFEDLFISFEKKLDILDEIRAVIDNKEISYNRLMSEVLFWGFSILEDNGIELPAKDSVELTGFSTQILNNLLAFEMVRSSFSQQIVDRYDVIANYIEDVYGINKKLYIETDEQFKQKNRALSQAKEDLTTNYQELRINKPEPSTYTIDDICRQMGRFRFLVRPPYQREEVINRKKSSEIIESLLLGIKLPPIFIFKNEDGVSEVIDGQQRILSILAFLSREYMNEKGEKVRSNKDGYALQLKDGILSYLHGKRFNQLNEELQEKISNFDLWVIEINKRNNPDFEPLDLFIRLNNKPYPIKDDTFEMWNSYIDRSLIDTIKASYRNSANWFFLRRNGSRMENENNYAVLSYFNYLEMNQQEATEKGPLDIYKVGRKIAIRLRSKGDISKILEDAAKKNAFAEAVNHFEFTFINNLRRLLGDDMDDGDKTLSKNLDELLGAENNKRTQQSFYALWYFLNGLTSNSMRDNRKEIRRQVRELFSAMQSDIKTEEFDAKVEFFRSQYEKKEGTGFAKARLRDIAEFISFDDDYVENANKVDFFIKRDNKSKDQIQIVFNQPKNVEAYYGCHINRLGFTKGYIAAVLKSNHVFMEFDFQMRNTTINSLKNIEVPVLALSIQRTFDNVIMYTQTNDYIQSRFFENVLDKMIEEVYLYSLFVHQNVKLLDKAKRLKYIDATNQEEIENIIAEAYQQLIREKDGLLSELTAATGLTNSIKNEENKKD